MNENPEDPHSAFSEAAVDAFAAFLNRIQEGEAPDIEELCSAHPGLAAELRRLYASWRTLAGVMSQLGPVPRSSASRVDVAEAAEDNPEFLRRFFERLEASRPEFGRYRMGAQVSEGGQGTVLRVFDEHLRRPLAMKVMLGAGALPATGATPPLEQRKQGRFLEEAQVTSQLDHPSIVPVHELGLDADGKLYFTMKLVRGRDLHDVIERVHDAELAGKTEWTRERALEILLKVCDAMAFAHSKGVVHRDLKPANIMVGQFGEVYVIDWGMARVLGREDVRDIRLTAQPPAEEVSSERRAHESDTPGSALYTQDGDVVGTLNYMPPEQAAGRSAEVGPRSDVYSTGAVLYHILSGQKPYDEAGPRTVQEVRDSVLGGPPTPLAELAPGTPEELLAICEKALAHEPAGRYADMREMAADVRAYLEDRVVRAHRTGPLTELRKWVRRNRGVAAISTALLLVTLGSLIAISLLATQGAQRATRERRFLDKAAAEGLFREADRLGVHPNTVSACDAWLERANALVTVQQEYAEELARLRRTGTPVELAPDPALEVLEGRLTGMTAIYETEREDLRQRPQDADLARSCGILENEIVETRAAIEARRREVEVGRPYRFDDASSAARHEELCELSRRLLRLFDPDSGTKGRITTLRERAAGAIAEAIRRPEWDLARARIKGSTLYSGMDLPPQFGLVPLEADPASDLWEFWHVASGARPERGPEGSWDIRDETGLVLVLVPGGTFRMGDPNLGPAAEVHDVELAPYFISKYEMTQGQWLRATGKNPSTFLAGQDYADPRISRTHPVETVSWEDARSALELWGLELPTEAQWERAARGGRTEKYWWGERLEDVVSPPRENFWDARAGGPAELDDGRQIPAPVNALQPNPYGLHNTLGNVSEWCRDWHVGTMARAVHAPGAGEILASDRSARSLRGVSFKGRATSLLPGLRRFSNPEARKDNLGVRPARRIEP